MRVSGSSLPQRSTLRRRVIAALVGVVSLTGVGALGAFATHAFMLRLLGPAPTSVEDVVPLAASAVLAAMTLWAGLAWCLSLLVTVVETVLEAVPLPLMLTSVHGRQHPHPALRRWEGTVAVLTPAVMRKAAAALVGLAIAGGTASPALADPSPARPLSVVSPGGSSDPLAWGPSDSHATGTSSPKTPAPGTSVPRASGAGSSVSPSVSSVVVHSGDSLWVVAERSLPQPATAATVAQSWPRWWAANRQVIGDDPDVLRPGQVLLVPTAP